MQAACVEMTSSLSAAYRTGVNENRKIRPVPHEVCIANVMLHQPPPDDDHAGARRPHGDVVYSLHVPWDAQGGCRMYAGVGIGEGGSGNQQGEIAAALTAAATTVAVAA